jgi:vitamin B12 transporter
MSKKMFGFLTALSIPFVVFSQLDSLTSVLFDPVIVTANKTEQKQSTTGKIITIISKEQLEKSVAKTVAQILNEQAGLIVNGALNNTGSAQTVFLRGASSGRTLILIDGIPMNDPSMINNEFNLNLLSINEIERIEICKGAQSTLYGSDALGGVINLITTKNDLNKLIHLNANMTAGNYGVFKSNVNASGNLGKFKYSARFNHQNSKGFSSAFDSTGTSNFDTDALFGNNFSASLAYQPNKTLTFNSFIQHRYYKTDVDNSPFSDARNFFSEDQAFFAGAGFTYKKSKVSITGNYQKVNNNRYYDNDFSAGSPLFSTHSLNGSSDYSELFGTVKISKNITAIMGSELRTTSMNSLYLSVSSFGPFQNEFKDSRISQYSVYGSILYSSDKNPFQLELGSRFNKHSIYGVNSTFTLNPSYRFNGYWMIMGSISSAYKVPSIYQLYDFYAGNLNLKPEEALNVEMGVQYKSARSFLRGVIFSRQITSGIDYNFVDFKYFNFVEQRVNGFEFESNLDITKALHLNMNYTYLSGQELTQNRETNKESITYPYLLRRPAHNLNLTLNYEISAKLFASLSSKSLSARYDIGGYEQADEVLPPYTIFSGYGSYKMNDKVSFFIDAQNLFNKKFFDIYGYQSIPFMISAGINLKF